MAPTFNYYWDVEDPALPYMGHDICNELAIVPDNATRIMPPPYEQGTIPCWSGESWVIRADWRQEIIYDINTGERATYPTVDVDEEYFKKHYTTTPPTSEFDKWDGEKWVFNQAEQTSVKVSKLTALRRKGLNTATVQISMLEDGIAFSEDAGEDTSQLNTLLKEWKLYRGQLVTLKIVTGDEALPTQPALVENMDG